MKKIEINYYKKQNNRYIRYKELQLSNVELQNKLKGLEEKVTKNQINFL